MDLERGAISRSKPDRGRDLRQALQLVRSSSRAIARQAKARYVTDVLTWPHRDEFGSVWDTVRLVPGWFTESSASLLYAVMRETRPETIVEIGSYLGRSTVFFALTLRQVNGRGRVVAIDPHTGDRQQLEGLGTDRLPTFELFEHHCRAAKVGDLVEPQVTTSREARATWTGAIDVLYVDGWHSYEAVIEDGESWLPHLAPGGVVVFDDYMAYEEVRQAVDELDRRGLFRLWGSIFGQAIGGTETVPPDAVRRALRLSGKRRARQRRAR